MSELNQMKTSTTPDPDRPLDNQADDLFSFVGIAKRLAPSILSTCESDGTVIGIEGPWGSGKTTLINFVMDNIEKIKSKNIHVIKISPWLSGDQSNLVSSLLSPIADILDQIDDGMRPRFWALRKKGSALGRVVRSYGVKTGRTLAPAARFAEYFFPGAKVAGDGLELTAEYLERLERRPTTAEVKAGISKRLSELDLGFVVILDDLDRLEPEQAVEVVRLVRSVADFPKITYVMCYERSALCHALKRGLGIEDADGFLQKIVQLTFAMPLPEPFDLRDYFFVEACEIFHDVEGRAPDADMLEELRAAIDKQGRGLKTPREVKLALNRIRFLYPSVRDHVYFPDVCRISLIKICQPSLYRWIEEYLSELSVLTLNEASISRMEKRSLGVRLHQIVPIDGDDFNESYWDLSSFVPGVSCNSDPSLTVLNGISSDSMSDFVMLRRLGSPFHHRNYFALNYPKHVITDENLMNVLSLAASDRDGLCAEISRLSKTRTRSGRCHLELLFDRLDERRFSTLDASTVSGLIFSIATEMDDVLVEDERLRFFAKSIGERANEVVRGCFRRLRELDADEFRRCALWLVSDGPSINWLVGFFFRRELAASTERADARSVESSFTRVEVAEFESILKVRVSAENVTSRILQMPRLSAFLSGWRDISGLEQVRNWVRSVSESDEGFLSILEGVQGWVVSDKIYRTLSKEYVSELLDWDFVVARIKILIESEYTERAKALKKAIARSER